jgi:hypothetical protein
MAVNVTAVAAELEALLLLVQPRTQALRQSTMLWPSCAL